MRQDHTAEGDASPPVSVGVIGCGWVAARHHLPALRALPETRLAAVADGDPARLELARDRFEVDRRHRDGLALVEDPSIEAVVICTPPLAHADLAVASLEAGKHVLVEKPLALSVGDCDRMIKAAAASDAIAAVGFNLRNHRLVRRARELIEAGVLGPVHSLQSLISGGHHGERSEWVAQQEQGGGAMIEAGVHHFDLWRHLLGVEVESVTAISPDGSDDRAVVGGRLSGGALASTLLTWSSQTANELSVLGTGARLDLSCLRFDGLSVSPSSELPGDPRARVREWTHALRELPGALRPSRGGSDFDASFPAQLRGFARSIRSGTPADCSFEDGRRALAVGLAATASAQRGEAVTVSEVDAEPVAATGGP